MMGIYFMSVLAFPLKQFKVPLISIDFDAIGHVR